MRKLLLVSLLSISIAAMSACGASANNQNSTVETKPTESVSEVETETKEDATEEIVDNNAESEIGETESEKFIAKGDTTLMNFLSAASDNGYDITNPEKNGTDVTAIAKGSGGEFSICYMVENQHVYRVEIVTDGDEISDGYKECVAAMAKAINPDIDDTALADDIEQVINQNAELVDSDTYFRYDSNERTFTITH